MKRKMMIIVAGILCYMIFTGFSFFIDSREPAVDKTVGLAEKTKATTGEPRIYDLESKGQQDVFVNYKDQFAILVPKGLKVDMSLPEVRSVLENENWRIEIYRQPLSDGVTPETYVNYSNQFMQDTVDHKKELETDRKLAGRNAHILQWSRQKISRIEKDKNYYACVDLITSEHEVYSFFFKSAVPFFGEEQYLDIVNSFYQRTDEEPIPIEEKPVFKPLKGQGQRAEFPTKWNDKTKRVFEQYFGESAGLTWGIFEPSAPESFKKLKKIENTIHYEFPFLVYYKHFNREGQSVNLRQGLQRAKEEERIPELTLQTTDQDAKEGNMVYDILNGELDPFIDAFIEDIKAVKTPVLFRFCNEMNGDWCMYSSYHTSKDTELFKELYRYIYKEFEKKEALSYVIWVWNPNERSMPDFKWNDEACYYPGNEYVDVVGLTGYNTGTYYEGEHWRSFDEIYKIPYERALQNYNKPLMITEFSCSSTGGKKEEWIEEMFRQIEGYDKIKVAIWWSGRDLDKNGNVARNYYIDESPQLLQLFKKYFLNR